MANITTTQTGGPLAVLMAAGSPEEIDTRVQKRLRQCGLSIASEQSKPTEWDLAEDGDAGGALAAVKASMTPPPGESIVQWLLALMKGSKRRSEDDLGMDLIYQIYVPRLQEFPADVVKHICLKHRYAGGWFPAIVEMEEAGDALCRKRRIALIIAQSLADGKTPHGFKRREVEEPRKPVSDAEREHVAGMILGLAAAANTAPPPKQK